jgi:2-polyprenyl-3-methyl-5-hydroxy-6-metoxy-1,4-benzoquinol methylase
MDRHRRRSRRFAVTAGSPRRTFDATPGSAHGLVVGLVPRGARVLELGCASGYMAEVLKNRLGCTVTGVELSSEDTELARAHCVRVVMGDVETLDFEAEFAGERFDALILADVLEHLRDPSALLRRIRPLLAEGAAVLASIPNVAHGSVRLALLGGEFRYREGGLLDRTHLRFFTRESIQDLFEASGYSITQWLRRRLGIEQSEVAPPARAVPEGVRRWLADDPEATTYQFVVRAVRSEDAEANRQLRLREREAEDAQRWSQRIGQAARELGAVIGPGEPFILIDEDQVRAELGPALAALPFPERDGQYWGPPADDVSAVNELERLRRQGALFAVVAWPSFWWLEYYTELGRRLRARYRRVLDSERVVVFDLRDARG